MGTVIHVADLFCGAGGTSTGLKQAADGLGLGLRLTAVNHWERAIETHAANHPWADHLCTSLEGLKPSAAVPGGRLDLLVASPECTHHSIARGGRPRCDQSRASAWHILHWCQELYVKNLLVENVPEFSSWGPLDELGKPIPSMKGKTFKAFVNALRSLSYSVDWRVINCADFGDATTRQRFFLMARRGRQRINWPDQTHQQNPIQDLFGRSLKPWRAAREVIDWSNPGHSIFLSPEDVRAAGLQIRRPLAANTLRRIAAGISRYWGEWAEPFLVLLRGTGGDQLDITIRSTDQPLPTITAGGGHVGLCMPFIVPHFGERTGQAPRIHGIDSPTPTATSHGAGSLVQPLILPQDARGIVRTVADGLPTITATGAHALVQPFVVKYYGCGGGFLPIDEPLATVTTDDRFGLVRPMIMDVGGQRYMLDILFRMLTAKELAAAHSFPRGYHFSGTNSDVVRQIGNSVPVATAESLGRQLLAA